MQLTWKKKNLHLDPAYSCLIQKPRRLTDRQLLGKISHSISFPLSCHRKDSEEIWTDKSSPKLKEKVEQKKICSFLPVEFHIIPYKVKFL